MRVSHAHCTFLRGLPATNATLTGRSQRIALADPPIPLSVLPRSYLFAASLLGVLGWNAPAMETASPDRRIVDTVIVGDADSEDAHGYAGHDDRAGVANDTTFREARGWMRYAMTTFDDTDVTIACTFAGGHAEARQFDVLVEDSLVASRTLDVSAKAPTVVEIRVPFAVTKGRTNVAVTMRGRSGPTPALRALRTIQDHHEFEREFVQAVEAAPPSLTHHLLGVVR